MPTKPKKNQPVTPNDVQKRDLFQTPNYAVDILVPFIPKNIDYIWECAAGERKIANRLEFFGYKINASDIREGLPRVIQSNFLNDFPANIKGVTNLCIVTNPPYSLKRKFFEKCLEYDVPFALLIPADYCGWVIKAIESGAEKIIPTRRIDYVTPNFSEHSGSQFHSMWLTKGFNIGKSETFVELTKEMKQNI